MIYIYIQQKISCKYTIPQHMNVLFIKKRREISIYFRPAAYSKAIPQEAGGNDTIEAMRNQLMTTGVRELQATGRTAAIDSMAACRGVAALVCKTDVGRRQVRTNSAGLKGRGEGENRSR